MRRIGAFIVVSATGALLDLGGLAGCRDASHKDAKPASADAGAAKRHATSPATAPDETPDEAMLTDLERRAFEYFWREADENTGLVQDRARNFGEDRCTVASVAATGFGLAALPIGVERGWITRGQGLARAVGTLRFLRDKTDQKRGWFFHFLDKRTGRRVWKCEVSSIDTAFLLAGALMAGEYFAGTEAQRLADEMYRRVDFGWMLTDGGARPNSKLICHGWKPASGFLRSRWGSYNELMILVLLGLGAPDNPIDPACWDAWKRPAGEYAGLRTLKIGPLFCHQYSQAFVDFRGLVDRSGWNYFDASVAATRIQQRFARDQAGTYKTFAAGLWGLSACDGPDGYRAYGCPPGRVRCDGTVAPWLMIASLPFTPRPCLATLRHIRTTWPEKAWGRCGLAGAINLDRDFWAKDVIGIDVGAALLMMENYRTGLPWRTFMATGAMKRAMRKAGFRPSP